MEVLYTHKPKIEGDTVYFSWSFSRDPRIFKKNEFYIKYDGLDIHHIDSSFFYEIFIGLMIPVLKEIDKEYLILLPEEIDNDIVNFWLSYNEADNIKVFPTNHFPMKVNDIKCEKKLGILFGGGKDSLFSYYLSKEIFDPSELLVISYVFPLDHSRLKDLDIRRENFALKKIREAGVSVQKIYTNFRSVFAKYSYFNSIHTSFYYLTSYPLYVKYGLRYLTYSYELTHYWNYNQHQQKYFHFKKSRPEFDLFVSNYMQQRLGSAFQVYNSNYLISENQAFQLLKERYSAVNEIMMCEAVIDTKHKWCKKCYKCGEFALYSLSYKHESPDFDLDEFLQTSDFIQKLLSKAAAGAEYRNSDGNVMWFEGLVSPMHFMSFCHIVNSIDVQYWSEKLSAKSIEILKQLKEWFGNKEYRQLEKYSLPALKQLKLPFEKQIKEILNEHVSYSNDRVIEVFYGNQKTKIDFDLQYPIKLENRNSIDQKEVVQNIIDSTVHNFNIMYKHQIKALNQYTHEEVPYKAWEDYRGGYNVYIDKSAPNKGDYLTITYIFEHLDINKSYHIDLQILSEYKSVSYRNRFKYSVLLDSNVLVEEDISDWNYDNCIHIYFNPQSSKHELTIRLDVLRDCEPWNWGKAAQLLIKRLEINSMPKIGENHVSCSSPYSKIYRLGG
ncbi:hypothetical protein CV632_12240 [Geobacillus thermodenitrificans]|uniref:hypothetical protein n=1 Tax=Geobacillus thermodenitrificans TaxID=33940 RepID=UPI00017E466D|nr:hypothetical protein [Geobacillus thermodenitrificans]ARP44276.1 hypothetical protein GTHT12_02780 [Geobacillus thermodenitrificans]PJW20111.1 hypothetical protein CV632_12240 [Geobacillus thermodenitrificans]